MSKLFVYGSLGPGGPNAHILEELSGSFAKAFVWGKLYEEGWGAGLGFPGIRLDVKEEKIEGYLFSSDRLDGHWDRLDDFEGEAYRRVKTTVTLLRNDAGTEAFIYELK